MWDVFICHASEDKDSIARPLAAALCESGLRVWYDDFTLRLGDSLRRSIDRGLAESRYGIVILSPHFFKKSWPQRELDGLTAKELRLGRTILPIWHGVTADEIERFSPPLADRQGVSTSCGIENIVQAVLRAVHPGTPSRPAQPMVPPPPKETSPSSAFDLGKYRMFVEYAYSLSGLNLSTKALAAEWADGHRNAIAQCGFEWFTQFVDYAYSLSGLNFSTRALAADWTLANHALLRRHGLGQFQEIVDYAYSRSGLNLTTRQIAAEWVLNNHLVLDHSTFARFKELVEYVYSRNGLNLATRQEAADWVLKNRAILGHDFARFKELVEYAYSRSGLNLTTRLMAAEWALSKLG